MASNVKDPDFLRALGNRIRELREKRGYTQLTLGELCDNHAEQIGRIERGEANVTVGTLKIIADALRVSLSELLKFKY